MSSTLAEVAGESPIAQVGRRRLALLWAAVAAAVVLHNAEEWLLDMTVDRRHSWLLGRALHGDRAEFALVLAIVTATVLAIAVIAVAARPRWSAEVLACIAYVLMVNGISHVLLSLLSWSPMPGVISGAAVLLPLGVLVVRLLPPVRWTFPAVAMTVISAVGVTAGAFALAALLTRLG